MHPYLTPCTNIDFRWTKDLCENRKIRMLIGENERLSLWLRCQGKGLTKPLKAQLIKQKKWWICLNKI